MLKMKVFVKSDDGYKHLFIQDGDIGWTYAHEKFFKDCYTAEQFLNTCISIDLSNNNEFVDSMHKLIKYGEFVDLLNNYSKKNYQCDDDDDDDVNVKEYFYLADVIYSVEFSSEKITYFKIKRGIIILDNINTRELSCYKSYFIPKSKFHRFADAFINQEYNFINIAQCYHNINSLIKLF